MTRRSPRALELTTLALLVAGCGGGSFPSDHEALLQVPTDVPLAFLAEVGPSNGLCRNPLKDPRDDTALRLVRSTYQPAEGSRLAAGYRGDYRVSPGKYGVRPGELLRVDCITGRAIGIVPE